MTPPTPLDDPGVTSTVKRWRRRRHGRKIEPGHGRVLTPFRWWQLLGRSLFSIALPTEGAASTDATTTWTVDVMYWTQFATEEGTMRAHLYRDGQHHARSTLPAAFPVPGGTIEVDASPYGLKRCQFVPDRGPERRLVPDPASGEARRARFDRTHPGMSRAIGAVSVLLLIPVLILLLPQLAEVITSLPPVQQQFGVLVSPVELPVWLNVTLTLLAAAASTERALRLRHHRVLDGLQ